MPLIGGPPWVVVDPTTGGSSSTNLAATPSPTGVEVASDTGSDAVIPLADASNAGLMSPSQVVQLASLPASLAGKASTAHGHQVSDILYLQSLLDEKASAAALAAKQDALVSGTSLKTVNGESLLGTGNVSIQAGTPVSGPYTLAQLQALSESGLTANISQAAVTSPAPAAGVYRWRGSGKGWQRMTIHGPLAELAKFLNLAAHGRGTTILSGGMRSLWTPPAGFDISKAVVPATNDQTGLDAAITAALARSTNRLVLLRSNITLTGNVTFSGAGTDAQPLVIASMNGSVLQGNFALIAQSYTDFIGLTINGPHVFGATATGQTRIRVLGCTFNSSVSMGGTAPYATGGVGDGTTSDNTDHTGWVIAMNEFVDCDYATYAQRLTGSWVRLNRVRHSATNYTRRGLWFVGCDSNRIEWNWVTGGRVGIAFLADRSLTKSVAGNVFAYNLVEDQNEEGISIDGYGNNGDKCSVADRLVVASTTGTAASSPRLICNRANATGINGSGNHAIQVISGSLAGRYFRIVGAGVQSAGVSVYLQIENNAISTADLAALVGAQITVVIHCANNVFTGNVVLNTQTPIMLWGMGHQTVILHNYLQASGSGISGANGSNPFGVSAAIGIWGIGIPNGGTAPTNGTAGSAYLCLPSESIVVGNYVEGGSIYVGGMTWDTQSNTESVMDPIPHRIGGNSAAPVVQAWRSGNSVTTLYSEAVGSITDIGGTYSAEALTLTDTAPLPAMV